MNNYVLIKIVGHNPSLYIKRLIKNNINYSNYKKIDNKTIIIKILYDDYLLLVDNSSIYDISIINYYGLIKYKNYINNNMNVVSSFILSILIILILSKMVFAIEIVHSDENIRNIISYELDKYNIKKYYISPSYYKIENIKKIILKEHKDDIEWIEITKKGSKLIVKVTERRINKKNKNIHTRHIVAKKEGIIKKIIANKGEILKSENDYVAKGDIIISGDIIKDETVKGQVVAKGLVYAEVWYKVNVDYPLYYKEIRYLPKEKTNVLFNYLNNDYKLFNDYDSSYKENKNRLIFDKFNIFEISLQKQRKIKFIKQKLSKQSAIKKASKLASSKIKKSLSKDEYIIDKKVLNFYSNSSKISIDIFFKVYENITDYKDTEKIEEENKIMN